MAWPKKTTALPAELEAELAKVRAAAPPPPSDDPIYKYLRRVYRLRGKIEGSIEFQEAIKAAHATRPRTATNYAGMIIQLTAPNVTANMKHKYTTVVSRRENVMFNVKACMKNANALCIQGEGVDDLEGFVKKFGQQFDSAGRWFVSNGLATEDKDALLGWSPGWPLLTGVGEMIKKHRLSKTLANKKLRRALAEPEAAEHFATFLAYLMFDGWTELINEYLNRLPKLEPSLSVH